MSLSLATPERTRRSDYARKLRTIRIDDLYDLLDYWCNEATAAERINDADGTEYADESYLGVWDELDRRHASGRMSRKARNQ